MTCEEFLDRHSEYLDGLSSAADAAAFEGHVRTCARCARYQRVVGRGLALVRELPGLEPSPDFADRLHHRLHHADAELIGGRRFVGGAVMLSAGLVAVLAALAWLPIARPDLVAPLARTQAEAVASRAAAAPVDAHSPFVAAASAPAAELWQPPSELHFAFTSRVHPIVRSPRHLPGPYSPVVVAPPVYRASQPRHALE